MSKIVKIEQTISAADIDKRVTEIAQKISQDYAQNDEIIFVGLLRGSIVFVADLIRKITLPSATIDFMTVSSYGNGIKSSRNVKIIKDLEDDIANKHVIVVEDIVDTGITLERIIDMLSKRNPKSLKVCTLLDKPARREVNIKIDYVGFVIEDYFVVGYGIDYAQKYRNLPYIAKVIL